MLTKLRDEVLDSLLSKLVLVECYGYGWRCNHLGCLSFTNGEYRLEIPGKHESSSVHFTPDSVEDISSLQRIPIITLKESPC